MGKTLTGRKQKIKTRKRVRELRKVRDDNSININKSDCFSGKDYQLNYGLKRKDVSSFSISDCFNNDISHDINAIKSTLNE